MQVLQFESLLRKDVNLVADYSRKVFLEDLGRGDDYVYAIDEASRTAFEFGVLGLPETFFIDRDGTVVAKVSGPVSYELLSGTLDAILLGESVDSVTTGEVENR